MSDLTEEKINSEQLVDGALLKVYRDQVRLPDGNTSIREWIDHPGASAMVPLFEDGRTILVRQHRYAPRRTFLEVPAGKVDEDGESFEEVALRELEEETGWKANRLTPIGASHPCIGYSNELIRFFLVEELERGTADREEGEFMEVVILDFDEALAIARRGEIMDMKSVAALFFAEAYLAKRMPKENSR